MQEALALQWRSYASTRRLLLTGKKNRDSTFNAHKPAWNRQYTIYYKYCIYKYDPTFLTNTRIAFILPPIFLRAFAKEEFMSLPLHTFQHNFSSLPKIFRKRSKVPRTMVFLWTSLNNRSPSFCRQRNTEGQMSFDGRFCPLSLILILASTKQRVNFFV